VVRGYRLKFYSLTLPFVLLQYVVGRYASHIAAQAEKYKKLLAQAKSGWGMGAALLGGGK
jgi:hypothetical protein